MNLTAIQQALAGLPLADLRYLERTGSTNDEAAAWVDAGAPHLSLVIADEQTHGRGRRGRHWFTPPASALAFSLVLREQAAGEQFPEYVGRYTALGALAVCQALREAYQLPASIKWPNDVLLGRQKVAGILVEAHWQADQLQALILGIGVNITPQAVPADSELIFPATCVEDQLGRRLDRLELLRSILTALFDWLPRIREKEFLQHWENMLAFRNEWVTLLDSAEPQGAAPLQAILLGLDGLGRLRLQDGNGRNFTAESGEIHLRPGKYIRASQPGRKEENRL